MEYIAFDAHKRYTLASVARSDGRLVREQRIPHERGALLEPEWTSGFELARGVDLLLHDAQYTREEYPRHVGWGHSTIHDALAFARLARAKHLVPFHHDPGRDDAALEAAVSAAVADLEPEFPVTPVAEGTAFDLE